MRRGRTITALVVVAGVLLIAALWLARQNLRMAGASPVDAATGKKIDDLTTQFEKGKIDAKEYRARIDATMAAQRTHASTATAHP